MSLTDLTKLQMDVGARATARAIVKVRVAGDDAARRRGLSLGPAARAM